MTTTKIHDDNGVYFIAYNDDLSVVHYGYVGKDNYTETSLGNVEQLETEEAYEARALELGIVLVEEELEIDEEKE